tara:strand:- start:222 stop:515 length:294 start_codon:yes stop_codon:yes gene_type:complete
MKLVFNHKMSCTDATICALEIQSKIEKLTGELNKIGLMYHISIHHVQNNHRIWVFFYDTDKIHESEVVGKTVYQDSKIIKKFIGKKPTLNEIEKVLE